MRRVASPRRPVSAATAPGRRTKSCSIADNCSLPSAPRTASPTLTSRATAHADEVEAAAGQLAAARDRHEQAARALAAA